MGRRALQIAVCGPGDDARPADVAAAEAVGAVLGVRGPWWSAVPRRRHGGGLPRLRGGGRDVHRPPARRRSRRGQPVRRAVVPTGLGELRNGLIVRAADGLVAVGGGFGTLSEIALARRAGLPVVGVDTWRLGAGAGVHEAGTPEEAARMVLALASSAEP